MNKVIRWPGFIAFVVIVGLIGGGTYLFANSLLKSLIESQGTNLAGAKVDVGRVELSLSPAGVIIHQLDITDAEQPMQNLVSIDSISAQFNLLKAFMGQLIIHDASVNGMRFSTPRQISGAIVKKPKPKKVKAEPSFVEKQLTSLGKELPDAKGLLEREPLLMDERQKILNASYDAKQQAWEKLEPQLPNEKKIKEYEQRIKAITEGKIASLEDFKQAEDALKQLKNDIRQDKETLEQAKTQLKDSSKELSQQLRDLKDAPKEDRDRILSTYTFDQGGLVNMSGLLFGETIRDNLETALHWYERIAPYLASEDKVKEVKKERTKGRFVRFQEEKPYPDFLIENMAASAVLEAGAISAQARDITHQQAVQNRPTTLHVHSEVLRDVKRFDAKAVFDYRGKKGHSTADFLVDEVDISDFRVSGGNDFPLTLQTAKSDMQGQLRLEDSKLSGQLHADFAKASFLTKEGKGLLALLSQAFADIHQFDLDVALGGSLRNPDISIRSDIDKQLKDSLETQVKAQVDEFRQEIEQQLAARLDAYLQEYDIQGFADNEQSLEGKINGLDALLKAKLDDFKDQQKQEVKTKGKEKLKKELKGLF